MAVGQHSVQKFVPSSGLKLDRSQELTRGARHLQSVGGVALPPSRGAAQQAGGHGRINVPLGASADCLGANQRREQVKTAAAPNQNQDQ